MRGERWQSIAGRSSWNNALTRRGARSMLPLIVLLLITPTLKSPCGLAEIWPLLRPVLKLHKTRLHFIVCVRLAQRQTSVHPKEYIYENLFTRVGSLTCPRLRCLTPHHHHHPLPVTCLAAKNDIAFGKVNRS